MRILAGVAGLILAVFASLDGFACPLPLAFPVTAGQLPATLSAIARLHLPILVLGGSATAAVAAKGEEYTYPARLAAHLREAFPGLDVTLTRPEPPAPRSGTPQILATLDADLARSRAALVIWGPGGSAAARGEDVDAFATAIRDVIVRARQAGADVILMSLQYAPSVARVVNLSPYRNALLGTAGAETVPVLDRYELMRHWNATDLVNLDATDPAERTGVARKVFDCVATVLANGIADAAR